ncbi:hypothetical protein [Sinomicrobium sp.]
MDIVSLEMGLLFLAVFMAPVAYFLYKQRSKKKETDKFVNTICSENGVKKEQTDTIGNYVFITDKSNKKLLVYHQKNNDFKIAQLGEYSGCYVSKSWDKEGSKRDILGTITLIFKTIAQSDKPFRIPLFDETYENPLEAEVILYEAEKLSRRINTEIFV